MLLILCCLFKFVCYWKFLDIYLNVYDRFWVFGDVFCVIFLFLYIKGVLWILMKKIVNVRI